MWATVRAIECFLPERVLTNAELASYSDQWTAEKIEAKTGIVERHLASRDQCATDLGVAAAEKLLDSGACSPSDVDYLLLCTQSPDYFIPSSACLIQQRLGLSQATGALDFNLGCSGFVYGLGLAKGLIETDQASRVMLITAETYSKYLRPDDLGVRTLFGDGAAATLIEAADPSASGAPGIGKFCYGTDGRGAPHLIVERGGMRTPFGRANGTPDTNDHAGATSDCIAPLYMNGPEVFSFTLNVVPRLVEDVLARANVGFDDVRWFVLHQANEYMLEHLRKKMKIPPERFCLAMSHSGNTVSSTIPIALRQLLDNGQLAKGDRVLLAGFGVGYSWAGTLLTWNGWDGGR